jgi:NAD(P)-dependent dehydrogenase (short-subunit alcohol dehydrogenase family)
VVYIKEAGCAIIIIMTTNPADQNNKVAVVTGSSSGIGLETSLTLARNGFVTYATIRNLKKADTVKTLADREKIRIKIVPLDVTDDKSVNNAIQTIASEAGRIDVLVNNAGHGLFGAFEDLSIDEIKNIYDTNFFGLVRVTQAVLPIMRRQKSGMIVNVSSGAGIFGFPSGSAYVSTKFAVEGLSESISYELEPFGIKVVLVEPGFIKTNFVQAMVVAKKSQDPKSPYSQMMQRIAAVSSQLAQRGSEADLVAKTVLNAVTSQKPNPRYLVGKDVEEWVKSKNSMTDAEFHDMMTKDL